MSVIGVQINSAISFSGSVVLQVESCSWYCIHQVRSQLKVARPFHCPVRS